MLSRRVGDNFSSAARETRPEQAELGPDSGLSGLTGKERVRNSYPVAETTVHWAPLWTPGFLLDTKQMGNH